MIALNNSCPRCDADVSKTLDITDDELQRWHDGTLIQIAAPRLTVNEREYLMTGFCDRCIDEVYA